MRQPSRPTLAVDFDGVIRGADGALLEGCAPALRRLHIKYRLVIHTARHDLDGVRAFLLEHNLGHLFADVTNRKPQAVCYLDDRAQRFESWAQVDL